MDYIGPINPAVNAVVIYIILTMLLYIIKPDFIYDHKQNKFKEITFNNHSIPIFYIVGAIVSVIIYYILYFASYSTYTPNYKYVNTYPKYRYS